MVGTKLFSFLTLPLIKQVIIYLHHSVVTLDWSNRFSQKTRHYGLGKQSCLGLLQTKAPWKEWVTHTYFLPLKKILIFISHHLALLGKPQDTTFTNIAKWYLFLEAIDLNTKPTSVYIWDIPLREVMCNSGESTELITQWSHGVLAFVLLFPTQLFNQKSVIFLFLPTWQVRKGLKCQLLCIRHTSQITFNKMLCIWSNKKVETVKWYANLRCYN